MPGFGSQVSLCDMPPHKKIWMTDLAWTFLALALVLAASSLAAFSSAAFCWGVFSAAAAKTREPRPPAAIIPAAPQSAASQGLPPGHALLVVRIVVTAHDFSPPVVSCENRSRNRQSPACPTSSRQSMPQKKLGAIDQRPGKIDPHVAPFRRSGLGIFLHGLYVGVRRKPRKDRQVEFLGDLIRLAARRRASPRASGRSEACSGSWPNSACAATGARPAR